EHIAVALLVLNFFWGAFVLVCTISRRRPWFTLTFLAMLAHGWVFHMGFMNFYLAMGLSFWALALLWRENWKCALGAAPLLGLAYLAHALPVAWALGIMIYTWSARRIRPDNRLLLTAAAVVSLAAIGGFLMARFPYRWIVGQILTSTGADQVSVFGVKYYPIACLTLALWIALLARLREARLNFFDVRLQVCFITSAATLLLPSQVLLPQAHHALGFINDRISLFVAILVCALLGEVEAQKWQKAACAGLAVLFFSFLYVDTRALNRIEVAAEARISELPANARVISGLSDPQTVINPLAHVIDRPCIGHCYSYANYEPSTAWFRVRALPQNAIVTSSYDDSDAMQNGRYVVNAADTPLFEIYFLNGHLETRLLEAGSVAQNTNLAAIPTLKQLLRGGGDRVR
ncbi:MAG TPA: hypothetical protein VJN43_13905, partial [Bryobacteraceae bacterium]|nr:hypothetical protein [Bryobacteraceae bacterium]